MWDMEENIKFYDMLFYNMLEPLASDIVKLIKLGIIMYKSDEKKYYPKEFKNTGTSNLYCWTNDFVYDNGQFVVCAYVIIDKLFIDQMEKSYSIDNTFPLIDIFMNHIIEKLCQIIQDDFVQNDVTVSYPGDADLILFQSIVDFFMNNELPDINCINFISSIPYEGNPCRGKILFLEDDEIDNCNLIKFGTSIFFDKDNYRMIRKLLELTNQDDCLLVNILNNEVVGIAYNIFNVEQYNKYLLEILGHMHWVLKYNDMVVLEYKNGYYHIIDKNNNERKYVQQIEKCIKIFSDKKNYQDDLATLINYSKRQKHGTMIIICTDACKEAERLCSKNRGIIVEPFDILKNKNIIESITSIDGALLLDENFLCYAIGVILDGIAVQGDSSRGARYNSALTYVDGIKKNHSVCAIVVSEDCFIDIIC